jgi:hypothetical protein
VRRKRTSSVLAERSHRFRQVPVRLLLLQVDLLTRIVCDDPGKDRIVRNVVGCPSRRSVEQLNVLEIADLSMHPPTSCLVEFRSLTNECVGQLRAEIAGNDLERPRSDTLDILDLDLLDGSGLLISREGEEEALTVCEEELEGVVAEKETSLDDLRKVAPAPMARGLRGGSVDV